MPTIKCVTGDTIQKTFPKNDVIIEFSLPEIIHLAYVLYFHEGGGKMCETIVTAVQDTGNIKNFDKFLDSLSYSDDRSISRHELMEKVEKYYGLKFLPSVR